jgi:hypothetical protein
MQSEEAEQLCVRRGEGERGEEKRRGKEGKRVSFQNSDPEATASW